MTSNSIQIMNLIIFNDYYIYLSDIKSKSTREKNIKQKNKGSFMSLMVNFFGFC